jgi:hypothetical protein
MNILFIANIGEKLDCDNTNVEQKTQNEKDFGSLTLSCSSNRLATNIAAFSGHHSTSVSHNLLNKSCEAVKSES